MSSSAMNISVGVEYQPPQELLAFAMLSVGLSFSFLYINSVLLFTLRRKPVFCDTSRYVLLYHLLFGDTVNLAVSILLYLLASARLRIPFYACTVIVVVSLFTNISPLTLAVMSLERFVAVCFPLRHLTVFTSRVTGMVIAVVWIFSFIHILVRVSMLFFILIQTSLNVQLNSFCSKEEVFFAPVFKRFEQVFSGFLFVLVGAVILASYVGVSVIARSASTDKASAKKALQTLLLHLIQLSLIITSTLFSTIILAVGQTVGRLVLVRIYNICFVCLNVLPRCLSALIYGLRDRTIRVVLLQNLCFLCKRSRFPNKNRRF
ncbi:odorant receptor 131-2-like [Mugil cephalus]|uniref:odorant receptor 131-2-like n=1 Tax=Mugil cephalus TaxID=48193 RepID=UPI001FB720C1|nr:odorant receptor 131-2-like [Mugil cephalus]